jgi:PilZ domain
MTERRTEFRLYAAGPARIVAGRQAPIDCTMYDISGSGGCLEVDAAAHLPDTFHLVPDEDIAAGYPCRVVWRKNNRVGIKFD